MGIILKHSFRGIKVWWVPVGESGGGEGGEGGGGGGGGCLHTLYIYVVHTGSLDTDTIQYISSSQ